LLTPNALVAVRSLWLAELLYKHRNKPSSHQLKIILECFLDKEQYAVRGGTSAFVGRAEEPIIKALESKW
jgi:hypothetical protein